MSCPLRSFSTLCILQSTLCSHPHIFLIITITFEVSVGKNCILAIPISPDIAQCSVYIQEMLVGFISNESSVRACFLSTVSSLPLEAFRHNLGRNLRDTVEETPGLDKQQNLATIGVPSSLSPQGYILTH